MILLATGVVARLTHIALSSPKRRWQPFDGIRRRLASRRGSSSEDAVASGQPRSGSAANFWELETSPFQGPRQIDLSLFQDVSPNRRAGEKAPSAPGQLPPPTDDESSRQTGIEQLWSSGHVQDVNGVNGQAPSGNHSGDKVPGVVFEEEFSYILVDEEGRPMQDPRALRKGAG